MEQIVKVVSDGHVQTVQLPADWHLDAKELYIRQDKDTGNVILSQRPTTWDGFFAALQQADFPDDFLNATERNQGVSTRDLFGDGQK